jgi:hypothetical protein
LAKERKWRSLDLPNGCRFTIEFIRGWIATTCNGLQRSARNGRRSSLEGVVLGSCGVIATIQLTRKGSGLMNILKQRLVWAIVTAVAILAANGHCVLLWCLTLHRRAPDFCESPGETVR